MADRSFAFFLEAFFCFAMILNIFFFALTSNRVE